MRSTPNVSARRCRYWRVGTTWPRREREIWVSATPTERASWAWVRPRERMLASSQPAKRGVINAQCDTPDSLLTSEILAGFFLDSSTLLALRPVPKNLVSVEGILL